MSAAVQEELLVLIPGPASEALLRAATRPGWRVVPLVRELDAKEFERAIGKPLLWLHPWTRLDGVLAREIDSMHMTDAGAARVVVAELEMECDGISLNLGPHVVLASAGSWRLTISGPVPVAGALQIELGRAWLLAAPTSISEHLEGLNVETTTMARLARQLGEEPRWSGIAVAPLRRAWRAWRGARGPSQRVLTRVFLEGYREAVATAKLWEASRGAGARGQLKRAGEWGPAGLGPVGRGESSPRATTWGPAGLGPVGRGESSPRATTWGPAGLGPVGRGERSPREIAGFVRIGDGILVRRGFEGAIAGWLERASRQGAEPAEGGRGAILCERLDDGERVYIRSYRRGGLLRSLLRDVYWDRPPRPWRELIATSAARERGVIAPEVLAAAALPLGASGACGLLYRGVLVTRAVEGRISLAAALERAGSERERAAWLECAVRGIRHLHASGIHHPDLNASNLLVAEHPGRPIAVIDFDRAVLSAKPIGALGRRLARRRLSRSIAKLGLPGLTRASAAEALRGIVSAEDV